MAGAQAIAGSPVQRTSGGTLRSSCFLVQRRRTERHSTGTPRVARRYACARARRVSGAAPSFAASRRASRVYCAERPTRAQRPRSGRTAPSHLYHTSCLPKCPRLAGCTYARCAQIMTHERSAFCPGAPISLSLLFCISSAHDQTCGRGASTPRPSSSVPRLRRHGPARELPSAHVGLLMGDGA
jgi:hypothetical protein